MSDIHDAAKELERAISLVDPSTIVFQKLDFHFETTLRNASFGVENNSVVIRFGMNESIGFAIPIDNSLVGTVEENLEKFLSLAAQIKQYQLVTNGTVNREVLQELKANLNSEFVMVSNGEVSDIELTEIRMSDESPKVRIFFMKYIPLLRREVPLFKDIHDLEPNSNLELFLKSWVQLLVAP